MNVERLNRVLATVAATLNDNRVIESLQALRDNVNNQVGNPGNPSVQQAVAAARDALRLATGTASSSQFSALDQEIVEELGISHLIGPALMAGIDGVFVQNEVTPAVIASELDALLVELNNLSVELTGTLSGLRYFRFATEELAPGAAELAVLIPRSEVREQVNDFGRELQTLDRLLAPFQEAATGESPRPVKLLEISSSDYGVYLDLLPQVALQVAEAIAFILAQYKTVLEVRELRSKVVALNLPQGADVAEQLGSAGDALSAIANDVMSKAIAERVESLELDAFVDTGRVHELRMSLKISYEQIAERIDRGYNFDVRAGAPEDPDDPTAGAVAEAIQAMAPEFKFVNRSGERILSLTSDAAEVPDEASPSAGESPAR